MKFKIAEHILKLNIPKKYHDMLSAYRPFVCDDSCQELFTVEVVETLDYTISKTLLEDIELANEGDVRVNIYQTSLGMLYNIIMPQSKDIDAQLHIVGNIAQVRINSTTDYFMASSAFTNTIILSFVTFTLPLNTLLLHASSVIKNGEAYLFIAKSGTGKSTHSRMWLEAFNDTELLNDDHPVVRYFDNGELIAYGSPWSGKTPCYRNISAPLKAIVRIKRAEYNKLTHLSPLLSYASLISTSSTMQWNQDLLNAKVKNVENIITKVRCCQMECLPNIDAAQCCFNSL